MSFSWMTCAIAGVPVSAHVDAAPTGVTAAYGGKKQTSCTSGFSVRINSSGVTALSTAGHCSNTNAYWASDTESHTLTFVSEIYDSDQDLQLATTTMSEYPRFNVNGTLRDVDGTVHRDWQDVGYWVCHQGKTTGYSCGNIVSMTHAPSFAGACGGFACASVWIKVEGSGLSCYSGDSGGPWFNNGYAYGTQYSASSSGPTAAETDYCSYMAINYLTSAGVTVLTQ